MKGKLAYVDQGRWRVYLRRFFALMLIVMFVIGLLGWVDGWGDQINQDVTQVIQKEADAYSSPVLVTGLVELLVHKWFDYEKGIEKWQQPNVDPTYRTSVSGSDYESRVISVSVESIRKTGEQTGEVTALVMREVKRLGEKGVLIMENRTDQIRIPLIYNQEEGKLDPLSGPIIEKNTRSFGVSLKHDVIQLDEFDFELLTKLAEGYVAAMSNGKKDQIAYFFKDQSMVAEPANGTLTLRQVVPIEKKDNQVGVLLTIEQKDETGLFSQQVHRLECERVGDRYLITKQWMGDQK